MVLTLDSKRFKPQKCSVAPVSRIKIYGELSKAWKQIAVLELSVLVGDSEGSDSDSIKNGETAT